MLKNKNSKLVIFNAFWYPIDVIWSFFVFQNEFLVNTEIFIFLKCFSLLVLGEANKKILGKCVTIVINVAYQINYVFVEYADLISLIKKD